MNGTESRAAPHKMTARSKLSIAVLLGLVLTVTAQLVTGFILMAHPGRALLVTHIAIGFAALVLTAIEWIWLAATRAGRHRLTGFFGKGSGPGEWIEALFLIAVSLTVLAGILLATAMRFGLHLPFTHLLELHRAFAFAVLLLYAAHSVLAMRRRRPKPA